MLKAWLRPGVSEILEWLPFVTRLADGSKSSQGLVGGITVVAVGGNLRYEMTYNDSESYFLAI